MKKLLLLFSFLCLAGVSSLKAVDVNTAELQDRSVLDDQRIKPGDTRYPIPFVKKGANPRTSPAISTGYYFVDSYETSIPTFWRPTARFVELTVEPNLWKKILSGPRQIDSTFWDRPENKALGLGFFRNPALPAVGSYFMHDPDPDQVIYATDSTNEAFAGPIPLGIAGGFYFNGIRYDSFYVSTNGVIALTNRRYFYNSENQISIPPGADNAYDPMSMDWFATGRGRADAPLGTEETRLPDNFGYQYSVLGNAPSNRYAGIRSPLNTVGATTSASDLPDMTGPRGDGLSGYEPNNKAALIAPFWGPLAMNVYNVRLARPIEFSEVWYKRSTSADKLIIYYKNITVQKGVYANRFGANNVTLVMPYNPEYGIDVTAPYASAQVVLDRNDSSVTFQYGKFLGRAIGLAGNRPSNIACSGVFQRLTVAGVRGFARHINYNGTNANALAAAEYEQTTHFNNMVNPNQGAIYASDKAVKFQQYKNTLRVFSTEYRVRGQEKTSSLDFITTIPNDKVADYELLAGEPKIGALQPVVTIQNLTNDIQGPNGVNYTPNGLKFRSRIKIINEVSEEVVYTALADINHANLLGASDNHVISVKYVDDKGANLTYPDTTVSNRQGIPPYGFAKIIYRAFEPSEFDNKYIGRLKMYIIAEPTNPETQEKLGDEWPFDDTMQVRLWVMKRLNAFKDDVTEFHVLDGKPVPSAYKWVNLGVDAISGDNFSKYPLAPRGRYQDERKKGTYLNSPELLFNTKDDNGGDWDKDQNPQTPDGDELRSFPIDLSSKRNPTLSLSIQRAKYQQGLDYPRGFNDQELSGPEPRVMVNEDPDNAYTAQNASSPKWLDKLHVEFAYPSPNGIKNITNIDEKYWKQHLKATPRNATDMITNVAAFQMFGGGGYCLGFLEDNKDSALTTQQGLRADKYDDGFDWDFKKVFIRIPNYILNAPEGGARNFRFRIKEWAFNYKKVTEALNLSTISDDDDPFIVDNVAIITQGEDADIEVVSVKIHWPYTALPASQASSIPLKVIISNNTAVPSQEYALKTFILGPTGDTVYCNITNQPILRPGKTIEITLPIWNARLSGPGRYQLFTKMFYIGNSSSLRDIDTTNDMNHSEYELIFSDSYVYDNSPDPQNASNDIPRFLNESMPGKGLNLRGYNEGGIGTATAMQSTSAYSADDKLISGYVGGDGSGEIAVKFQVFDQDTIYGFKAFFGEMSVNSDNIFLKVYRDGGSGVMPELQHITGGLIERQRGRDDIENEYRYGRYVTYLLDNPIKLDPGNYWVSIVQRGAYGLELGAKADRMGMRTTSTSTGFPPTQNLPLGINGISLLVDKNLRIKNSRGELVNNNMFCYQNSSSIGSWVQFSPDQGNPAYAHLNHYGVTPGDNFTTYTFTRGTWIPMLRPYFGERRFGQVTGSIPCPDPVPVELSEFDGHFRNNNVELYWKTASETSNKGFYVEKAKEDGKFESIGFVEGNGTTKITSEYAYSDSKVENGNTYLYRLKQVDMDPRQCAKYSNVVKINVSNDQVTHKVGPTPFNSVTYVTVTLPSPENVNLAIIDMFGNEVKSLQNGTLGATSHKFAWDGKDANGIQMPSGSYIYRLTVNGQNYFGKITLAR